MQGGFTNVNPVAFLQRFSTNLLNNRWILLNHIPLGHISFFLLLWPIISWDESNQEIKFVFVREYNCINRNRSLRNKFIRQKHNSECGDSLLHLRFKNYQCITYPSRLQIQHDIWRSGTSCLVTRGVQRESTGPNYDYKRQHTASRDSFLWFNEYASLLVLCTYRSFAARSSILVFRSWSSSSSSFRGPPPSATLVLVVKLLE